ncbi:hypothetical protein D6764_00760 [Candidatus Woesearchaeota archaeon]|nr:MAG: hypothetical protein D6764_00760 [Candidatus Woesearchaeota archaeon]
MAGNKPDADAAGSDELYIGISDPVELRREILESSRSILRLLQRYERFKAIRQDKEELFSRLKTLTKEITELDSRLKGLLPKRMLKNLKMKPAGSRTEAKEKSRKEKESGKKIPSRKPASELEKIESSLNEIEEKLRRLS